MSKNSAGSRRRHNTTRAALERLVKDYAEASAAFASAQSAAGTFDALLVAYHVRRDAERALKKRGFTVDQAYARLGEYAREDRARAEECAVCEKPGKYWARDVNALGPWVAVCSTACEDAALRHTDDCDCDDCKEGSS